jgi:hypothetical protein
MKIVSLHIIAFGVGTVQNTALETACFSIHGVARSDGYAFSGVCLWTLC